MLPLLSGSYLEKTVKLLTNMHECWTFCLGILKLQGSRKPGCIRPKCSSLCSAYLLNSNATVITPNNSVQSHILSASERSERDTYRGKNEKIGDVCLFVYMYGRT